MRRQPSGHRGCAPEPFVSAYQTWQAQALVLRAEVVDRSYQVRARVQARVCPRERARASRQATQTTAERPVESFDVSRIDVARALRRADEGCDGCARALIDMPRHTHDTLAFVAFDDLREQQAWPFDQLATPALAAAWQLFTKDALDRRRIALQAVHTEEQRAAQGRSAAFDALDQPRDELAVALWADFRTEPQTGLDTDGHRQPKHSTLRFDAHFVALHLPQILRLFDQVFVDRLAMSAALDQPFAHGAFVKLEGSDNRLYRAAVRKQGQDLRDQRGVFLQTIKDGAFAFAKGLVTEVTDEAPLLRRMHADIALPELAFGRTVGVRAECLFRGEGQ